MTVKLLISAEGWLPKAMQAINAGESVELILCGAEALRIAANIQTTTTKMGVFQAFQALKPIMAVPGTFPIDPSVIAPLLATIGAAGGALGSVAYVVAVGVAHGAKLSLLYKLNNPLDPTDDEAVVQIGLRD